jgi:hypothetical protein
VFVLCGIIRGPQVSGLTLVASLLVVISRGFFRNIYEARVLRGSG